MILGVFLRRNWKEEAIALGFSSVLFAILHTQNYFLGGFAGEKVLRQTIAAVGGGLLYGVIRLAGGSTWTCALTHAVMNLNPSFENDSGAPSASPPGRLELPLLSWSDVFAPFPPAALFAGLYLLLRHLLRERGLMVAWGPSAKAGVPLPRFAPRVE